MSQVKAQVQLSQSASQPLQQSENRLQSCKTAGMNFINPLKLRKRDYFIQNISGVSLESITIHQETKTAHKGRSRAKDCTAMNANVNLTQTTHQFPEPMTQTFLGAAILSSTFPTELLRRQTEASIKPIYTGHS